MKNIRWIFSIISLLAIAAVASGQTYLPATVTVYSSDTVMGTVAITAPTGWTGSGTAGSPYSRSCTTSPATTVTVVATPKANYKFIRWEYQTNYVGAPVNNWLPSYDTNATGYTQTTNTSTARIWLAKDSTSAVTNTFTPKFYYTPPAINASPGGPIVAVFAVANTPPLGAFETAQTVVYQGRSLSMSGWAADNEMGAPVTRVDVLMDGTDVADATLSGDRQDIATQYGKSNYRYSGWSASYSTTGLSAGSHTVSIKAWDAQGASTVVGTKTFTVARNPSGSFQILDAGRNPLPLDGGTLRVRFLKGTQFYVRVSGTDPDGNLAMSYCRISRPDSSVFAIEEKLISGSSCFADFGPYTSDALGILDVMCRVSDTTRTALEWNGGGWYGMETPDIDVYPNTPAQNVTITAPPSTIRINESISLSSTASDPDSNLEWHVFYQRGARSADTFAQDSNNWVSAWDSAALWTNWNNGKPAPDTSTIGPSTTGAASAVSAVFTPQSPGFWQFEAIACDSSGLPGTPAATNAVFVAPLPTATISATSSGGTATGSGSLLAYSTEVVSVSSTATAAGWLSEHNVYGYTGSTTPSSLVAVATGGLSGASGVTSNVRNGTWSPPGVGTYTLYAEAFTGRSSGERVNGTSGYPGYLDGAANKRITVTTVAPVRNALLEWWGNHSAGTIPMESRVGGVGGYSFNTGNTITLRGFSQDTDGILDTTSIRIEVINPSGASVADWSGGDTLRAYWSCMDRGYTFPAGVTGNYTVRVTTTMSGGTAVNTWTLPVANRAPAVSMSASPASISFGQTTTVAATATDADGNLAFHGILALNQAGNDWYRSPSTDHSTGWGNHPTSTDFVSATYTSGVVSGGSSTRSVVHRPSWIGTLTYHSNAYDGFVWASPNGYTTVAVGKATPAGTFVARSPNPGNSATYTIVAGDLNAAFANPYSTAVAAPTGTTTYSVVACPLYPAEVGRTLTAGSTLIAGAAYTIRATYPGDANYSGTTIEAAWNVQKGTQTAVTTSSGSTPYGTPFTPPPSGGNGSGAYQWEIVAGGTASGAAINTTTGVITTTSTGTVLYRVRRLGDKLWNDSAWSTPNSSVSVGARAITVMLAGGKAYNATTASTGALGSITSGSLAPGDTIGYAFASTSSANVGSYTGLTTATVSNATAPTTRTSSYAVTYAGSYSITKADQAAVSVGANPSSIYTSTSSTITASGGSGTGVWTITATGGTLTGSGATRTFTANTAGSYTVSATKAGDTNYNPSSTATTPPISVVVDTTKPTPPTGLVTSNVGSTSFTLSWTASTDNVGVTDYEVFKDGVSVGLTGGAVSKVITGLTINTEYTMTVCALDLAGNKSTPSAEKRVTTIVESTPSYPGRPEDLSAPTSDIGAGGTVVGSTAGSLSVGKNGEATYSIPIWVVPGTGGMEPKLSLSYSSQAGPGIAGYGWSIGGLSTISRGPKTLAVDGSPLAIEFQSTDAYYLDGERLIASNAAGTEFRTLHESFTKIESVGTSGNGPQSFKASTKSGLTIEFGVDADSRVEERTGRGVLSWAVTKITDDVGNYMTFVYEVATDGQVGDAWGSPAKERRIKTINYTGNGSLLPYASVQFNYTTRLDARKRYVAGVCLAEVSLLQEIVCSGPSGVAKRYKLDYENQYLTNWSLLNKITESGDSTTVAYNPTKFDYRKQTAATMTWQVKAEFVPKRPISKQSTVDGPGTGFVDLNGDGWPDFVAQYKYRWDRTPDFDEVYLGSPTGWQASTIWNLPYPLAVNQEYDGTGARFVDLDGDGYTDFVWATALYSGVRLNDRGRGWRTAVDSAQWTLPTFLLSGEAGSPLHANGTQFADVNGDGLIDIVVGHEIYDQYHSRDNDIVRGVYISNGNGWDPLNETNWKLPEFFLKGIGSDEGYVPDTGLRLVDLNGDGLPDLLQSRQRSDGSMRCGAWINTGNGWTEAPKYLPSVPIISETFRPWGAELTDINGDGLIDLICYHLNQEAQNGVFLNTGDGWVRDDTYLPAMPLACNSASGSGRLARAGSALIDLNQDGLPDNIWSRGFTGGQQQGIAYVLPNGIKKDNCFGDPLVLRDYFLAWDLWKYIDGDGYGIGGQFCDLDADGSPDFVWNHSGTNVPPGYAASGALRNSAERPNLLKAVTNGLGVRSEIEYQPISAKGSAKVYEQGTEAVGLDKRLAIGPMYVVSKLVEDAGTSDSYSLTYTYSGLRSSPLYGSLGFRMIDIVDSRSGVGVTQRTTYSQDFPWIGQTEKSETFVGALKVKESKVIAFGSKPFARIGGKSTYFTFPAIAKERTWNLNTDLSTGVIASESITYIDSGDYDDYGNLLGSDVYLHDVTATPPVDPEGVYPDMASVSTTNTYFTPSSDDLAVWRIGLLKRSVVTTTRAGADPVVRTTAYTYHDTKKRRLGTVTVEPDSTDYTVKLATTRDYDDFGNTIGVTSTSRDTFAVPAADVARTVKSEYDSRGRFPDWTSDPRGDTYKTYYTYDQNLGLCLTQKGPDALTTTREYDVFGRATKETAPDNTATTIVYAWTTSGSAKYFSQTEAHNGSVTVTPPSRSYFDRLGRKRQTQSLNGDGRIVYTDAEYNNRGLGTKTSQPYFAAGTIYYTEAQYDALGRPTQTRAPMDDPSGGSTVLYSKTDLVYSGLSSTTTLHSPESSTKLQSKTVTVNSLGQAVCSEDNTNLGSSSAERTKLEFAYNALGSVATSTVYKEDGTAYSTSYGYDLLGRKTSMSDPDMGAWTYEYDAFGQLRRQTDARRGPSNAKLPVEMTYDSLGRILTRTQRELLPTDRTVVTKWAYVTSGNGLGKLSEVRTYSGAEDTANIDYYREIYTYDSLGRPQDVKRAIYDGLSGSGGDFATPALTRGYTYTYTYADGRLVSTTYPGPRPFKVQQSYSQLGFVTNIQRADGTHTENLWQAAQTSGYTTDVFGKPLAARLGNGLDLTWGRAARGGGLKYVRASFNQLAVRSFDYQYDGFGNVSTRSDAWADLAGAVSTRSESYTYDALQRLIGWSGPSESSSATYDALGNILSKTGSGGDYEYLDDRPHAVSAVGNRNFTYDADGNCTGDGQRTMDWTSFNQVQRIAVAGGPSTEFFFDADRQRVRQKNNDGTTVYVGGRFERFVADSGGAVENRFYVMAPTGRIALHTENDAGSNPRDQYFVADALGSVASVYDQAGRHIETRRYDPWGVSVDVIEGSLGAGVGSPTARGFTDHEMLEGVGLVHMNGRVYDQTLGRFLSADSVVDGAGSALGYNRYSYVQNNPLGRVDPTGHGSETTESGSSGFSLNIDYSFQNPFPDPFKTLRWDLLGSSTSTSTNSSLLNGSFSGEAFQSGTVGTVASTAFNSWADFGQTVRDSYNAGFAARDMAAFIQETLDTHSFTVLDDPYYMIRNPIAGRLGITSELGALVAWDNTKTLAGYAIDIGTLMLGGAGERQALKYGGGKFARIAEAELVDVLAERGFRSANIGGLLPGGTGRALAGHGLEEGLAGGFGRLVVPEGTSIMIPGERGLRMPDLLGRMIEAGDWESIMANPQYLWKMQGSASYLPGAEIPNLILYPAPDRWLLQNSFRFDAPIELREILKTNMGHLDWAACRQVY